MVSFLSDVPLQFSLDTMSHFEHSKTMDWWYSTIPLSTVQDYTFSHDIIHFMLVSFVASLLVLRPFLPVSYSDQALLRFRVGAVHALHPHRQG